MVFQRCFSKIPLFSSLTNADNIEPKISVRSEKNFNDVMKFAGPDYLKEILFG